MKDKLERPRELGPTGIILVMDWSLEPDWYNRLVHWRAWIPLDWAELATPWYHKYNESVYPEEAREGPNPVYQLSRDWVRIARKDITAVMKCCRMIRSKTDYPSEGPLPVHFSFDRLLDQFKTSYEAEIVAADARCAMLDGLGFLGWWCGIQPTNWEEHLPQEIIETIKSWSPVDRKTRGVLFDIHRDWQEMNIGLLVRKDVPIFYPWTIVEATNPRFSRLSPAFLKAYDSIAFDAEGHKTREEIHLADMPGIQPKVHDLSRFDEFLQDGFEGFRSSDYDSSQPVTQHTRVYIKDFYNWKIRLVSSEAHRRMYARRFYSTVIHDGPSSYVMCWRFRPTSSRSSTAARQYVPMDVDDQSDYGDDEDDDEWKALAEEDYVVREIYKLNYAPNPGCVLPTEAFLPISSITSHNLWTLSTMALSAAKEIVASAKDTPSSIDLQDLPPIHVIPDFVTPIPTGPAKPSVLNRRRRSEKRQEYSPSSTDYDAERACQQRAGRMQGFERDYRTDRPKMPRGMYIHDSGSEDFYYPSSSDGRPAMPRQAGSSRATVPVFRVGEMDKDRGRPRTSRWVDSMSKPTALKDRLSFPHAPRPVRDSEFGLVSSTGVNPVPTYRPPELATFLEELGRSAARFTYAQQLNAVSPKLQWNEDYLRMGVLYVPRESSEVRMRYWANTLSNMRSMSQVLTMAIEHGIPFQIAIPANNVEYFRPELPSPADLAAGVYYTNYTEPELTWGQGGMEFLNRWQVRAREILGRPHARAAIFEGGPLAWLARKLRGDEIVARAMQGPSVQTTLHQKGFIDVASGRMHRYDQLSESESNVVLGFTSSKSNGNADQSLFPSPAILAMHWDEWSHEVNAVLDHMMNDLWDSFMDGKVRQRTPGGWYTYIHCNNHGSRKPAYIPTSSDWFTTRLNLVNTFTTSWDMSYIRDLTVPEPYLPLAYGL